MKWYYKVLICFGLSLIAASIPVSLFYDTYNARQQATIYLQNVWRKPFVIDKSYNDSSYSVRFYSEGKQLYLNIHNNGSITINNEPRGSE